jgi:hypothetical protein
MLDRFWKVVAANNPCAARGLKAVLTVALAMASPLAACARDDGASDARSVAPPGHARRDSAGITITENQRPAWGKNEEWTVAREPFLRIGGDAASFRNHQLTGVVTATRFNDGRIAVALKGNSEIRLFDAAGNYIASAGRKGAGPGEFSALDFMERYRGDSLVVWDGNRSRVTLFNSEGSYGGTAPVTLSAMHPPEAKGAFGDGTILAARSLEDPPPEPAPQGGVPQAFRTPYVTIRTSGEVGGHFTHMPPHPLGGLERRDPVTLKLARSAAYGNVVSALSTANSGVVGEISVAQPRRFLFVRGDYFYYADAASYEVHVHSRDGHLVKIIRANVPAEVIPESEKRDTSYVIALRGGSISHRADKVIWADYYPHFSDLFVDRGNNVWLARFPTDRTCDCRPWFVFDAEGVWQGAVKLPASIRVLDIGANYVLGVHADELGVESVQLFSLNTPGR